MPWDNQEEQHGPWSPRPSGGDTGGRDTPPQGPDLDEILRRIHTKSRQFFSSGDNSGKSLLLTAIIAVLLWLSSGIYFVHADQEGVVLRFGAYSRTTAPGLNYHLPYPIETVETPRVTAINHVEIGFRSGGYMRAGRNDNAVPEESLMLTGDENIVDIDFEVQWRISSAPDFLFNVRNPEETVKAVSESAMREIIGKTSIIPVISEGAVKLQVAQDTRHLIQETLDHYKAGIDIVAVNLLKADPPTQVIDAFHDLQSARADMETASNQAEAYRSDILPRARGDAQKLVLDAEAYKQQAIADAQGQSSRFLAIYSEYRQSRDVTRKRLYLETMEEILQGMNKIIVDPKGAGVVPYLPLPELKAKSEDTK
ncbi:MAG: FtsH protease activity modulator HflK [Pseudomonadota bacterium]|nr:FtsH protease activity modulator HflK [Pseudomonadota bacterium]